MSTKPEWAAQIERCLRLAAEVDDPLARERLYQLAEDYRARAAEAAPHDESDFSLPYLTVPG